MKRRLDGEEVKFTDILGNTMSLPTAEVRAGLEPTVTQLAQAIAEAILGLNQGPPDGVILVGGGQPHTPSSPKTGRSPGSKHRTGGNKNPGSPGGY